MNKILEAIAALRRLMTREQVEHHMSADLLSRLLVEYVEGKPSKDAIAIIYPTSIGSCAFATTRPSDLPFHSGEFIEFLMSSELKIREDIIQELRECLARLEELE